jgi:hypothetical protein
LGRKRRIISILASSLVPANEESFNFEQVGLQVPGNVAHEAEDDRQRRTGKEMTGVGNDL